MTLSAFDLYSIGIGPSSSHTVGPMRAAKMFVTQLSAADLGRVRRVEVNLYGSLGATGRGHGSEGAVILGLEGEDPATVDVDRGRSRIADIRRQRTILLNGTHQIGFDLSTDLVLRRGSVPQHPNTMTVAAFDIAGSPIVEKTYLSIGGGFVVDDSDEEQATAADTTPVPHRFGTAAELLDQCRDHGLSISQVMMRNELVSRTRAEVRDGLLGIWQVMRDCMEAGCHGEGNLPGGLQVPRRAPALYRKLVEARSEGALTPNPIDWVNLYALSVNEQNASGGRVVTAPTNGAAGIIPAVLRYYVEFVPGACDDGIIDFLLTAAAVGVLCKLNASISGAELGCQGEVGSACAMAAGALCELLGGTPAQVENAAEIGIEHHLGLTCDPVGGLVQIPCIERNAIAAVTALNAAQLSLHGDGTHKVSLDQVIQTMRDTGRDMDVKYKETSRGGLAVNVVEC